MSIHQKTIKTHEFAAFDVIELQEINNAINLKAGDKLYCLETKSKFNINSVVSYALEYGEEPIEAYKKAALNDYEVHWINQLPTSLHSGRSMKKYNLISIKVGQKVKFEGRIFEITETANNNRGLKELI